MKRGRSSRTTQTKKKKDAIAALLPDSDSSDVESDSGSDFAEELSAHASVEEEDDDEEIVPEVDAALEDELADFLESPTARRKRRSTAGKHNKKKARGRRRVDDDDDEGEEFDGEDDDDEDEESDRCFRAFFFF